MSAPVTAAGDFEAGTIDPSSFGHRDHIRVVWELIHAHGMLAAVSRFEAGLKRITAAAGHPEKYHATITHAFAFLVGQRIAEDGPTSWDHFVDANPDLFEWPNSALAQMYPNDALHTDAARRAFVMPYSQPQSHKTP